MKDILWVLVLIPVLRGVYLCTMQADNIMQQIYVSIQWTNLFLGTLLLALVLKSNHANPS
jgi:hypothetical protein